MEKICEEQIVKVTKYQAIDGTLFTEENDCGEYEQTVRCVMHSRYENLVIAKTNAWEMFKGDECDIIDVVKITSEGELNVILTYITYITGVNNVENIKKNTNLLERAIKSGQVFIKWNEDRCWCNVLGSLSDIIDSINNHVVELLKI